MSYGNDKKKESRYFDNRRYCFWYVLQTILPLDTQFFFVSIKQLKGFYVNFWESVIRDTKYFFPPSDRFKFTNFYYDHRKTF